MLIKNHYLKNKMWQYSHFEKILNRDYWVELLKQTSWLKLDQTRN